MHETSAKSDAPGKKQRRPWLIIGGLTLALLGVLTFLYLRDDAPPDDSDFLPLRTAGGGRKNPLALFFGEVRGINMNGWHPMEVPSDEMAAENEFVFQAMQKLMATDPGSWRLPDDHEDRRLLGIIVNNVCSGLFRKKIHEQINKAEQSRAVALALAMHQFGHKLLSAEGDLHLYGYALQLQRHARVELMQALEPTLEGKAPPALLQQAQEALTVWEPQPQMLALALRENYQSEKAHLLDSTKENSEMFELLFPDDDPAFAWRMFRRQRAIGQLLKLSQQIVSSLNHGWGTAQSNADEWMVAATERVNAKWARYANPNFTGDRYLQEVAPWNDTRATAVHITLQRMNVAFLAIRRFELTRHASPHALGELVPDFLPAVPVDAMNLAPLKWDATTRELCAESHWRLPDSFMPDRRTAFTAYFSVYSDGMVSFSRDGKILFHPGSRHAGETGGAGVPR